jgi:predicted AAA+ superfamily ATPase
MLDYQTLRSILESWSYWTRPLPQSVPRRVLARLPAWTPDIALVVQGVRRCGKSTLLTQLMTHFDLAPRDCIFVNFEDPRLAADLRYETLEAITRLAAEEPRRRPHYFFLDEIRRSPVQC